MAETGAWVMPRTGVHNRWRVTWETHYLCLCIFILVSIFIVFDNFVLPSKTVPLHLAHQRSRRTKEAPTPAALAPHHSFFTDRRAILYTIDIFYTTANIYLMLKVKVCLSLSTLTLSDLFFSTLGIPYNDSVDKGILSLKRPTHFRG